MCLSTVYIEKKDNKNKLMENVSSIEILKDGIKFIDIMERSKVYKGKLLKADLVDGYVIVSKEEEV